jgi:GLPGLI family protein
MKPILVTIYILLLTVLTASAQYTICGKIEYEKKTNVHAVLKDNSEGEEDTWYEQLKAQAPKFKSLFFELTFDTLKSIYKPGREIELAYKGYTGDGPAIDNIVLTDFGANKVTAIKHVYEQKFLVKDSIRNMNWIEKSDIRTIAGYKCHKAVGKICDSVYIVAYYTEDIIAPGGPEMFGGLPGMILELAIPRLHTTWVANKIELISPKEEDFALLEKGKKVNEKELYETIQSSLKDWGKWATRNIWWVVI